MKSADKKPLRKQESLSRQSWHFLSKAEANIAPGFAPEQVWNLTTRTLKSQWKLWGTRDTSRGNLRVRFKDYMRILYKVTSHSPNDRDLQSWLRHLQARLNRENMTEYPMRKENKKKRKEKKNTQKEKKETLSQKFRCKTCYNIILINCSKG